MSTPTSRRGRKVKTAQKQKATSSRIFLFVIGAVVIAGVAALVTFLASGGGGGETTSGETSLPALGGVAPFEVPYATGVTSEGFHFKGATEAPVTVVEYADYQCPACQRFATSSLAERLNQEYITTGQIQYILHDYPLPMHPHSQLSSQAAYCAGDQGQYWQMHDYIFQTQQQWSPLSAQGAQNHFVRIAGGLELDQTAFASCLDNGTYSNHVQGALQAAQQDGIPATPTFVVNGQQVPAAQLETTINRLLNQ